MTYGTRVYRNGKITGSLEFSTGKRIFLNYKENLEFAIKLREIEYTGRLKERSDTK